MHRYVHRDEKLPLLLIHSYHNLIECKNNILLTFSHPSIVKYIREPSASSEIELQYIHMMPLCANPPSSPSQCIDILQELAALVTRTVYRVKRMPHT